MVKSRKTSDANDNAEVRSKACKIDTPYTDSAFYEAYRWIAFLHRWNGLNFIQELKPKNYQNVRFKFCSLVTLWCFMTWGAETLAVVVLIHDLTGSFNRDVEDKFTELISFLMVVAIVISVLSTGVTALIRAKTKAKIVRDCSDLELVLQLPKKSRFQLMVHSKAILIVHVLYGAASLAVSVMMAHLEKDLGWKAWIMAALIMKIRLSALTITEFVIYMSTFFRLCVRKIVDNMVETQNEICGLEHCQVPGILARQQQLYIRLSEIISTLECLMSPVLFLNISANFFNCVCCVYLFVKGPALATAYADTWIFFAGLFCMVLAPCTAAGRLVVESQNITFTLNALVVGNHANCVQKQVKRFAQIVNNKQLAISASGFFSLRLETVISMLGTLTTYGMLLIQSHDYFGAPKKSANTTLS